MPAAPAPSIEVFERSGSWKTRTLSEKSLKRAPQHWHKGFRKNVQTLSAQKGQLGPKFAARTDENLKVSAPSSSKAAGLKMSHSAGRPAVRGNLKTKP